VCCYGCVVMDVLQWVCRRWCVVMGVLLQVCSIGVLCCRNLWWRSIVLRPRCGSWAVLTCVNSLATVSSWAASLTRYVLLSLGTTSLHLYSPQGYVLLQNPLSLLPSLFIMHFTYIYLYKTLLQTAAKTLMKQVLYVLTYLHSW